MDKAVIETDIIKIPQFNVGKAEHTVYVKYKSVAEFVHLANRLGQPSRRTGHSSPPVAVLRRLSETQKLPFQELQVLFDALKEAAFTYRSPEFKLQESMHEHFHNFGKWDKHRSTLKKLTKKHTELMVSLIDSQRSCWKSRSKMKQYVDMLECAMMSLPYYQDNPTEYNARKHSIKTLKKDLRARQKTHCKNFDQYHKLLLEEKDVRQEIKQIASELELGITGRLQDFIIQAWTNLRRASDPQKFNTILETDVISKGIYDLTCKNYIINIPPNDVSSTDFNSKIERPRVEDSVHLKTEIAHHTYGGLGTCEMEVKKAVNNHKTLSNFLSLKKGNIVKLKLLSSGKELGFGYKKKHSKFSGKKWGFVSMSDLFQEYVTH